MKVGCSFVERPVTVDSSDVRKRIAGCGNRRCTGEHKHARDTSTSGQRWLVGRGGVVLSADKTVNLVTHRLLFTVDRPTAGRETGDDQSPVQPRIRRDYPLNLSI